MSSSEIPRKSPSPRPLWIRLSIGVATASVYLGGMAGYRFIDSDGSAFLDWFGLYTLQFLGLAICWLGFRRGWLRDLRLWVAVGLVARVLVISSEPVMAADYLRYLWDAHVWSEGVNPYLHEPISPELDELEVSGRFLVQWSQYKTIYPPFAQFMFRVGHALGKESVLAWKIVLSIFDFGIFLIIYLWLSREGRPAYISLLYFLNPLVLKETYNSAHLDLIPVFWTCLALYWRIRPSSMLRWRGSWIALGLGITSKLYPIILVPLWLRLERGPRKRLEGLAWIGATVLLCYLPFLSAGNRLVESTMVYARYWTFNASLFRIIDEAWKLVLTETTSPDFAFQVPAKLTVIVLMSAFLVWRVKSLRIPPALPRESLHVLGAVLLLAPVVDGWYVLWILPLAVLELHLPALVFTYLVGASYAWFYDPDQAFWFRLTEYAALYLLLFWTLRSRRL